MPAPVAVYVVAAIAGVAAAVAFHEVTVCLMSTKISFRHRSCSITPPLIYSSVRLRTPHRPRYRALGRGLPC